MELAVIILTVIAFAVAAALGGADSRHRSDDLPHRSI